MLLALVLLALANLDARPMKGWIRDAARAQGVALDFERGRVTLGGLRLRGLRIASPPADARRAPHLVTVGAIEGQWSLWSQRLDSLVIRDVAITVVRSADGTTSLDRWLAGLPQKEEPPPEPLSQLLSSLVPPGLEAHARVQGVTFTVLDDAAAPPRTLALTTPGLAADLRDGVLTATLGPEPLRLTVDSAAPQGTAARELVLGLRGLAKLDAQGNGSLALGLTLERQTLTAALPPLRQVLTLAAALQARPAEHLTSLQVTELSLLDGAATLTAKLGLREVPASANAAATLAPELDDATLRLDLPALARAAPLDLGPLVVEGEPLLVRVRKARLTPAPRGELEVTGKLTRLVWRELAGERLGLTLTAGPDAADGDVLRAKLELPIGSLRAPGLQLTEATVSAEAERRGLRALLAPSPPSPPSPPAEASPPSPPAEASPASPPRRSLGRRSLAAGGPVPAAGARPAPRARDPHAHRPAHRRPRQRGGHAAQRALAGR
ncbi:MAG: hypothetical protein IPI49_16340 [Myxococcales bacterium]|nr:hypothetical protein [Myxococcales bacterium]